MTEQTLSEILARANAVQKINKSKLARDADVPYDVVRELMRRPNSSTSYENGVRIVRALTGSAEQEATGHSPFVSIPRYNVELSAGGGAINQNETELDRIPFTEDFLKDRLSRDSIDGLVMVKAAGESMEPTITDGDLVMVDTQDHQHKAGIFAFLLNGESFVKRLEWIHEGVTIISDHPSYPPRSLGEDEAFVGDFELIGRVRWVGRTFG